jgi:hypothetical protein
MALNYPSGFRNPPTGERKWASTRRRRRGVRTAADAAVGQTRRFCDAAGMIRTSLIAAECCTAVPGHCGPQNLTQLQSVTPSLDHFVGYGEQRWRNVDADRVCL